jgi:uncharacterized membrane protein YiaA
VALILCALFLVAILCINRVYNKQDISEYDRRSKNMVILKSRMFWTLVVGLVVFVVKQLWPAFPLSEEFILGIVVFILGLFGITPELRSRGLK